MASLSVEIERVLFSIESIDSIKKLSGFKKGFHTVPNEINHYSEAFVENISSNDVNDTINIIYEKIKSQFEYKRKDIKTEFGRIITPDFEVTASISISEEDPSEFVERIELSDIQSSDIIESEEFNNVFSNYFDTLEFEFNKAIHIENLIDSIEDADLEGLRVTYPKDCSFCQVYLDEVDEKIIISSGSIRIIKDRKTKPIELVKSLTAIRSRLLSYEQLNLLN